jgi:Bacterial Ig domain
VGRLVRLLMLVALCFPLVANTGTTHALAAVHCGKERWSVKTGTDQDADLVNLGSVNPTTVADLISRVPPDPIPKTSRVPPVETKVWRVDAVLTGYKREDDSDYHLVLTDSAQNTMIVEIAHPDCVVQGSPFAQGNASAREEFNAALHATSSFKPASIPVRVTGVGFFDFIHGQTGVAPNGIELHPVLDILFNPPPITRTTEFLVDGGFEPDPAPDGPGLGWTSSASPAGHNLTPADAARPRTGVGYGSLGGRNLAADELAQTVFIPQAAAKASLTFWASVETEEAPGSGPFDFLHAEVRDAGGNVLTSRSLDDSDASAGYVQVGPIDLVSFAGEALQIAFRSTTDFSLPTIFLLDDVSVTATMPGGGDATPPTTEVSSPESGSLVTGSVEVTATASDDAAVARLELYVDGALRAAANGNNTLAFPWVTSAESGPDHVLRSKAYDTAGNVWSSPPVAVTVSNQASAQLLLDPGLEGGAAWTATPGVISNDPSEPAHTGAFKAKLDGYGTAHTDSISQQVTIPAGALTAELSFWLHVDSMEGFGEWDQLTVEARSPTGVLLRMLDTFSNSDEISGYSLRQYDLSELRGQTVVIVLTGKEDSILRTAFLVDDFALDIS